MTIDRTIYHGHMLFKGAANAGCATEKIAANCTGDSDTTAAIKKIGLSRGVVVSEAEEEMKITYYGAFEPNGAAWPVKDQDKNASTQDISADAEMVELPDEIAGVPWLIPVVTPTDLTGTGTPGSPDVLNFHFEGG